MTLTCISVLAMVRWERWYRYIRVHHTGWEYVFLFAAWISPVAAMAGFVMNSMLVAHL
jgi:hypothetical protein